MIVPKPWYESKTFWFNVLAGVIVVFWNDVKGMVSPEVAGAVVVVGNLLLRYLTTQPITLTGK